MRASQDLSRISTRFDDPNLVSRAGLLAPVSLAQALGLADLVDTHLTMSGPGSANRGLKTLSVVGAMLAGGDSIEDVDVLRAGGNEALLGAARAPSTIGTWLRRLDGGSVRQLDKVARLMLVRGLGGRRRAGGEECARHPRRRFLDLPGVRAGQARRDVRVHESPGLPPAAGHPGRDR